MSDVKRVQTILPSPATHWVGDGFPVTSVVSPLSLGNRLSPLVLMDYAGPAPFEPSDRPRGVDSHPHRGFETVTVVYQGELEHRDSVGNSGKVGPGDVQWMTAASGVLHEEKHSDEFTEKGGVLEMAQLWINLPARRKMDPPRYQELRAADIPVVTLPDGAGSARVIAGAFEAEPGAASTHTPLVLWDIAICAGSVAELPLEEGYSAAIFIRSGAVEIGANQVGGRELAVLTQTGRGVAVRAEIDSKLLVVGGEPIDEPIVAHGPFVMNTTEEIRIAVKDFRKGKFGVLE